jgi:CP family cyanate transporter-like MFS transporter
LAFVLLWLGGFDIRVTLLALPPAIPAIHRDLPLDEKAIGILTTMPTFLLGLAAIAGALLISRVGTRRALVAGLLVIAAGSALRGLGPSVPALFTMTALMGIGIALTQPVLPTLTRQWFPARIGLATAVYSNGLLVGEAVPASLTGPLVLPLLHGAWPLAFAVWSAPVLLTAGLALLAIPREAPAPAGEVPRRWWPDFRDWRTWHLGLMMGFASAGYFGVNAFLPDFLRATHQPGLTNLSLASLNVCQLPASALMLAFSRHLIMRRWPFVLIALVMTAALVGMILQPGPMVVAWAGLVGFTAALALILTLTLPPLLAPPADVARLSAGIFLVQYISSFASPVLGGADWDASGNPDAAFWVVAAGGVAMLLLAATLNLGGRQPVRSTSSSAT